MYSKEKLGIDLHQSSFLYPQADGKTEVVNRSSRVLLRNYVKKNIHLWDLILAQIEFAYKRQDTNYSPFEVISKIL